jgi:cytochrome c5
MLMIRIAPWLAFSLVGCSNTQPEHQAYQPDLSHGEAVYQGQCGSCHDTGKRGAPSIADGEDWDLQTLAGPGIVQQHLAMNLLKGPGGQSRLSEYDEADVLFYIKSAVANGEY